MNSIIRKRIGKDLTIQLSVLTNGEALSLEGRLLTVELRHELLINACQKMGYTVSGNRITIKWYGKDQRHLGKYHLTIWENYNEDGQTVVDVCNQIELVKSTCLENDMNNGLDIDTVDLGVTDLAIGIKGESAYETWLKQGHVGSEADFIAWLRHPSEDAAVQATEAASKAMEAAQSAGQAVENIQRLDEAVTLSENKRAAAERDRVTAEQQRATAEKQRQQATTEAIELMQTATSEAVQSVKDEASATLSNVQSEASTTLNRVQTESTSAIRDVQTTASDSIKAIKDESTATLNKVQTDTQTAIEATNQAVSEAVSKANTATGKATEAATRAEAAAENAVLKIAQELTPEEQTQVQSNIGVKDTIDVVGVGEIRLIDVNNEKEGNGYWNKNGVIAESSSTNYFRTKPIPVNQGDIILLKDSFATAAVMPIVRVQSDNTFISVIASGNSSVSNYSAIAQAGYISLSISKSHASRMQALIIPCRLASLLVGPAGGYCHSLYEAAGAVYDAASGMWKLNDIDLSVKEIAIAYNDSLGLKNKRLDEVCHNSQMKTNFPSLPIGSFGSLSAIACFANCNKIESIKINNSTVCYLSSIAYMCFRCRSLHSVSPIIDVTNCTVKGNVIDAFKLCSNLKNVKLRGLNIDVSFSDSPSLSTDSILYLISNSANKSITITLHPEAYDRAMSDSSITAALAAKPLITIAK